MEGKPGPPPRFDHKNRFAVLIADRRVELDSESTLLVEDRRIHN
jgi:hypothetical protein